MNQKNKIGLAIALFAIYILILTVSIHIMFPAIPMGEGSDMVKLGIMDAVIFAVGMGLMFP